MTTEHEFREEVVETVQEVFGPGYVKEAEQLAEHLALACKLKEWISFESGIDDGGIDDTLPRQHWDE